MNALHGLVLAGGQSRRMGTDKAALEVDGESLLARTARLLRPVCTDVAVSVRSTTKTGERARYRQIVDRHGGRGPADGIASALSHGGAWLVVACDLPRLDNHTLTTLLAGRDRAAPATAFASRHNGLPEPLCAIYEATSLEGIEQLMAQGVLCPRKMLIRLGAACLPAMSGDTLANANTPDDWARSVGTAPTPATTGTVRS